jgi:uncharacterized protein YgiM (DUF1202 family)
MMKRLALLLIMTVGLAAAVAAQVNKGQTVYVTAKSLALKAGTGFFAKTVATVTYGDSVTVLAVDGKWAQVRTAARPVVSGWTAQTNLSTKRVTAAGGTGSASSREVAMAGKGFSEEVENSYKEDNRDLNYAAVDATEANMVSETDLLKFIEDGRLLMGDE